MSVSDWKTMSRKQQEVVLNVWEKMLETMKFRAAKDKGDFNTNLHGLHAPKHTPFDTALAALKELCGTPKFYNPCHGCVFLGNHESWSPKTMPWGVAPKDTWYDLYYCNQGHKIDRPMLSARFGDAPKLGDTYTEEEAMDGAMNPDSTIGQDLSYLSGEPEKCEHPVLWVARNKAVELGLISPSDEYLDTAKGS